MIQNLMAILFVMAITSCSKIRFPSAESRTDTGVMVWNEVSWSLEKGSEVWRMRQSHHGPHLPFKDWDELKIIVKDKKVEFFQLKNNKEIPFKASCFMCHSNGPRAIRPDSSNTLTISEKVQLTLMNLRIKTYGPLEAINKPGFRLPGELMNGHLKLAKCLNCHNPDGVFTRNYLTRQNAPTIRFMVNKEHMPPIGRPTQNEKLYIENFLNGF